MYEETEARRRLPGSRERNDNTNKSGNTDTDLWRGAPPPPPRQEQQEPLDRQRWRDQPRDQQRDQQRDQLREQRDQRDRQPANDRRENTRNARLGDHAAYERGRGRDERGLQEWERDHIVQLNIQVPRRMFPRIIGKGGATRKELEKRFNVTITVPQRQDGTALASVSGPASRAVFARSEIEREFKTFPYRGKIANPSRGGGAGGCDGQ